MINDLYKVNIWIECAGKTQDEIVEILENISINVFDGKENVFSCKIQKKHITNPEYENPSYVGYSYGERREIGKCIYIEGMVRRPVPRKSVKVYYESDVNGFKLTDSDHTRKNHRANGAYDEAIKMTRQYIGMYTEEILDKTLDCIGEFLRTHIRIQPFGMFTPNHYRGERYVYDEQNYCRHIKNAII